METTSQFPKSVTFFRHSVGEIDELRISRGILTHDEFLCYGIVSVFIKER